MPGPASCRTYRFLSAVVLNPLLKVLSRMGLSPSFDKSQFDLLDFRSYAGETLFTKLGLTTFSMPTLENCFVAEPQMAAGNEYLIHVELLLVAFEHERVVSLGMSVDNSHSSIPPARVWS